MYLSLILMRFTIPPPPKEKNYLSFKLFSFNILVLKKSITHSTVSSPRHLFILAPHSAGLHENVFKYENETKRKIHTLTSSSRPTNFSRECKEIFFPRKPNRQKVVNYVDISYLKIIRKRKCFIGFNKFKVILIKKSKH